MIEIGDLSPLLAAQCGYLAKSSGELLWTHHLNVWRIADTLASFVPTLSDPERRALQLAALTHDIGKAASDVQSVLRGERSGPAAHKLTRAEYGQEVARIARSAGFSDGDISLAWEALACHHYVSEQDVLEASSHRVEALTRLLIDADHIGSMEKLDVFELGRIGRDRCDWLALAYVEFSRFPSPTTDLCLESVADLFRQYSWRPLVHLDNASIFVAPPDARLPSKKEAVEEALRSVQRESLRVRSFQIRSYSGNCLSGLAASHPDRFLEAHRDKLLQAFADGTKVAIHFLKSAAEIAKIRGYDGQWKDPPRLLRWLWSANSPVGQSAIKDEIEKETGNRPETINKEFFDGLFREEPAERFLPGFASTAKHEGKLLADLSPESLLEMLCELAAPPAEQSESDLGAAMQASLEAWIAMAEETDFAAYAREQMARYTSYKDNPTNLASALCERCAATASTSPAKSDQLADSFDASSQIKAKKAPRAFCPFCLYDNLVARGGGATRVWIRIDTRTPIAALRYDELKDFVHRLASSLRKTPRRFKIGRDIGAISGLPLPPRLAIPLPDERDKFDDLPAPIPRGEHGVMVELEKPRGSEGPAQFAAQYEPLYHLLRMMGLSVAIGFEEPQGLFGTFPRTDGPAYSRSLAAVLLARSTGKTANKHLFARHLLEKAPAVAIAHALGEGGENRYPVARDLMPVFLQFLLGSDLVVAPSSEGGYMMKDLLKDAAFLADPERGIRQFCEPPPRGRWSESRHAAAKPISQALEVLLHGHGTDLAKQKFRDNLRINIAPEKKELLADFVAGVNEIVERFDGIRAQSVTEFLRAKNALTAAVYTYTRYPELLTVDGKEEEHV